VSQYLPNNKEYEFLSLAYTRFEEIWQIYTNPNFYDQIAEYRFSCIKEAFSIYSEVITYQPIRDYLEGLEQNKDKLWLIMNIEFPKVVRNIILHFPFSKWDDIYINKSIATWNTVNKHSTIDKFFEKYKGVVPIEVETLSKSDISNKFKINFPVQYDEVGKTYLKDMINEESGVDLFMTLMRSAMASQMESLINN
jgi:hypothetical protein